MKYFFLSLAVLIILVIGILGFRGDLREARPWQWLNEMDQQQKFKAQSESTFFADGRAARQPIPGTIPTTKPVEQEYWLTGAMGDHWGDGLPVEVNPALLQRGQERYAINCQVCHGAVADGKGITSQYGLVGAANLQQENYRQMADGEIFNTIGNGKGQMMGYGANLKPEDRWAIVAYLRALQRSQNASMEDVPASEQTKLATP